MTDRERVIYDIERCICRVPDACLDCSKYKGEYTPDCMEQLLGEALELLKEREPVMWSYKYNRFVCSNCDLSIEDEVHYLMNKSINFCPTCGKEIKWND